MSLNTPPPLLPSPSPSPPPQPLPTIGGRYNVCAPGVPSGGPVLLFALKVLDNYQMTPSSAYQNLTYHRIAEVCEC